MSKSWGNVVDPLDVIDQFSTDALRLSCVLGNTPGNNLNFSIKNVEEYSLYLNKFWNIIRFVWMNIGDITEERDVIEKRILQNTDSLLPYERWILSRLSRTIENMTEGMEDSSFSASGVELLSFIRDEFADFAIEAYKIEKNTSTLGKDVLSIITLDILALLHPYAPHITEMLYGYVTGGKLLITSHWPVSHLPIERSSEESMNRIFDIVRVIRNIRAESKVPPSELRNIHIIPPSIYLNDIESNASLIVGMTRSSAIHIGEKPAK